MTTTAISGGAHTHPELQSGIETTQAMLAQVLDGQATILDTLNVQAENQARMQADISEMKSDIADLQTTVGEMKTDIAEMKADIADLQTTVGEMKTDIAEMKADISEMKTSIGELQSTVGDLQTTVGEVARGLAVVQADVTLLVERDS